jgi:hypothetical protein
LFHTSAFKSGETIESLETLAREIHGAHPSLMIALVTDSIGRDFDGQSFDFVRSMDAKSLPSVGREFQPDPVDLPRLHYIGSGASPFEVNIVVPPHTAVCGDVITRVQKQLGDSDVLFISSNSTSTTKYGTLDSTVIVYRNNPRVQQFFKLWALHYLEDCVFKAHVAFDVCGLRVALSTSPLLRYKILSNEFALRYKPGMKAPSQQSLKGRIFFQETHRSFNGSHVPSANYSQYVSTEKCNPKVTALNKSAAGNQARNNTGQRDQSHPAENLAVKFTVAPGLKCKHHFAFLQRCLFYFILLFFCTNLGFNAFLGSN